MDPLTAAIAFLVHTYILVSILRLLWQRLPGLASFLRVLTPALVCVVVLHAVLAFQQVAFAPALRLVIDGALFCLAVVLVLALVRYAYELGKPDLVVSCYDNKTLQRLAAADAVFYLGLAAVLTVPYVI